MSFDPAREPLRALRDLINSCETVFGTDPEETGILERAQAGLTALRALFGDTRPADTINDTETMAIEPGSLHIAAPDMLAALKNLTRAASFEGMPDVWTAPVYAAIGKATKEDA